MRLKQTHKQIFFLPWRQLETLLHSLILVSGSFSRSFAAHPVCHVRSEEGTATGHSLLTLVLQECSTTLKSRGSCSRGTFTIFPAI